MKHSVGLFSVLMLILLAVIFRSPALAQEPISVIRSIAWRPDGEMLAVGGTIEGKSAIQFYDSDLGFLSEIALTGTGDILSLAWSPDNTRLAILVGASPDTIYIWDITSQNVTATIPQEGATTTNHIAWSPDSTRLAFVRQLSLTVWNENADELTLNVRNTEQIQSFAWHPNDNQIIIAGADQMLRIWDTTTNAVVDEYKSSSFPVSIAFNPEGTKLAIGGSDGTIQIVDSSNISSTTRFFQAPEDALWEIAWSPQGDQIAAGGSRTNITIWDTSTGEKLDSIQRARGGFLETLAYNPMDGRLFYATNPIVSGAPTAEPQNPDQYSRTENMLNGAIQIVVPAPQLQTPTPSATIQSEAQTLRSIFNAAICQRACWLGIEPGVTTQEEVRIILSDLGIMYEAKDELGLGADPVNNPYGWLPDDNLPFIDTVGGKVEVRIYFSEGMVQGIHVPVNIPVKTIIEEYGAPIQVRNLNTMFELIYPQLGMNFFVSSLETDHATMLTLFSEKGALQNVEDPGSPYLLQDCALFSTPCTIATATPTTASQNPSLQNIFHSPACQSACFMGIEPGITTQTELETLLDQHQLEFTKSSIASGHLILYTVSARSSPFWADDKPVYIDVTADHVDLMTLFLQDVTVAQVTSEYGAPDAVVGSGGTSNFIIYVAEGLIFATESADTDSIGLVFLTPPGRDALRMHSYLSDFAPCSGLVTVCGVTTATPTP